MPVGQTASPEVGRLFYTTSVLHGPTHNPWDLTKAPGGSSGGSGAALSAGLVPLATGSDMGGSIRLPAGWCGVVGVKGTYGRVPRSPGYLGHANMVHYGPLARSVRDCARYLDVTVGVDQRDPYSLPPPAVPYEQQIAEPLPSGLRVAVVDDLGMSPSDPEVAAALHNAAAVLIDACGMTQSGATLTFPNLVTVGAAVLYADADPAGAEHAGTILMNLMKTPGAAPLMELAFTDPDLTLEGVAKTNQMRHLIDMQLAELFADVDILLVPASPVPAFGVEGPIPTVVAGKDIGPAAPALFMRTVQPVGQPGRVRAHGIGRRRAGRHADHRPPPRGRPRHAGRGALRAGAALAAARERATESSGRRCAHGRAASSCALTRITVASSHGRPTSCTPTGRPSSSKPEGTDDAGWPVVFHMLVNGVSMKTSCIFERSKSLSAPTSGGGLPTVGVSNRS